MDIMGTIYIVSTPIGNLSDITYRAVETLKNVDFIIAEDTRRSIQLLNHFGIKKTLISYHSHNELEKVDFIINKLKSGQNVALVTDAGTPIISDPGNVLIEKAIDENINITAVPGACAAINALVLSGLDATKFVFIGFLSEDNKKRKKELDDIRSQNKTMIIYISPHNILRDLSDLMVVLGEERKIVIAREMTKKFEEIIRGTIKEIYEKLKETKIMGEFVLVVSGCANVNIDNDNFFMNMDIKEHYDYYIKRGYDEKSALKQVALDRDIDKREVYKFVKIGGV